MNPYRDDFPFLIKNPDNAYLDNAATTLKPQVVIDAVVNYYENLGANVNRGDFKLSLETSKLYEAVRDKTAKLLNSSRDEVIFTSGASESLNLMAHMVGKSHLSKGDVVLLNEGEHASNILPWYHEAQDIGFEIEYIPLNKDGGIDLDVFEHSLHEKVKVISIGHISNVLGKAHPIEQMTKIAHQKNILVCVDGAQAIGHTSVDVAQLDVDFYAFSAHKMLGPSGVGVLYGKLDHLDKMDPLKMGGGSNVRFNECGDVTLKKSPHKFESGTPNIEGVLGFGAAIDYLMDIGFETVHQQTHFVHQHLLNGLKDIPHVQVYNPQADVGIVSLNVKGIFAQDVSVYLDTHNISVRAGEHCAKLLNGALELEKSVRVSLYFYNTIEEVDRLIKALKEINLEDIILDFI